MLDAFAKTLAQLPSPPFRRVLWLSIAGSVATAVVLWFAIDAVLVNIDFFGVAWLESVVDNLGGLAAAILLILLFPAFIGIFAGFLLEAICRAVEARYYPHLPAARSQSLAEAVWVGLRFALILVVANLIVLPLYLVPIVNVFVYWGLNGYLLGREYFELVAVRRLAPAEMRALRRRRWPPVLVAGLVCAGIAIVPLVNLILPLFGTAFMLHVFERLRGRESAGIR